MADVKSKRKSKDPDKKQRLRLLITLAVTAPIVLTVAVLAYFFPYRDLLPALEIPARAEGEMQVHFIDVGEGDATLIEFSDGDCLLVDAGDGGFSHAEKLFRYLRGMDIASLSVLCSHADADHCGGIADILETFEVDTLYLPVVPAKTSVYERMLKISEEKGIEQKSFTRYDTIAKADAYIVCLSPYSIGEENENESSALLYLDAQGVRFVLGADIPATRERRILREYALDPNILNSGRYPVALENIDFLRVSHHGSSSSSSEEWLKLLGADVAIISCGQDNVYAHPAEGTVQRLSETSDIIYRTDELGDIMVTIHAGKYSIHTGGEGGTL